jgi:hypothetical protein
VFLVRNFIQIKAFPFICMKFALNDLAPLQSLYYVKSSPPNWPGTISYISCPIWTLWFNPTGFRCKNMPDPRWNMRYDLVMRPESWQIFLDKLAYHSQFVSSAWNAAASVMIHDAYSPPWWHVKIKACPQPGASCIILVQFSCRSDKVYTLSYVVTQNVSSHNSWSYAHPQ